MKNKTYDEKIKKLMREKRPEILRIAAMHGARNVHIFGSTARGRLGQKAMWIFS